MTVDIERLLGDQASYLLDHKCEGIGRDMLILPSSDFVTDVIAGTDRSPQVMRSLQTLFDHGRLGGTGYVSILPVDQGIEHSGAASFAPNPIYFDPASIVELGIEGGCNAVATTFGVLGAVSAAMPTASRSSSSSTQRAADLPGLLRPDHVRISRPCS